MTSNSPLEEVFISIIPFMCTHFFLLLFNIRKMGRRTTVPGLWLLVRSELTNQTALKLSYCVEQTLDGVPNARLKRLRRFPFDDNQDAPPPPTPETQ
jgi:hypothetical protein